MQQPDIFHVLVLISLQSGAGRKKLSGIHQFLGEGFSWDIELLRNDADFTPMRMAEENARHYDGMMILTPNATNALQAFHNNAIPTVFSFPRQASLAEGFSHAVFVHDDINAIMRIAVSHLLAAPRIASLGFVPARTQESWSDDRARTFARILEKSETFSDIYSGGDDMDALSGWLENLPKPAGVVAAFDDRARDVLVAARNARIDVPRELAVLGIGNDEPICEMMHPSISSVAVDFRQQGYRAARELQAMMLRRLRPKQRDIAIGAAGVVVRDSTEAPRDNASLVKRAMTFIKHHACESIEVDDVVRHMRVSRRLAYLMFEKIARTTIHEAILTQRIGRAKELLEKTDDAITDIAMRCGYGNSNYFKNVFRRKTGLAPTVWRRQHRNPAP